MMWTIRKYILLDKEFPFHGEDQIWIEHIGFVALYNKSFLHSTTNVGWLLQKIVAFCNKHQTSLYSLLNFESVK